MNPTAANRLQFSNKIFVLFALNKNTAPVRGTRRSTTLPTGIIIKEKKIPTRPISCRKMIKIFAVRRPNSSVVPSDYFLSLSPDQRFVNRNVERNWFWVIITRRIVLSIVFATLSNILLLCRA